jgi:serine/threonine protein kinase
MEAETQSNQDGKWQLCDMDAGARLGEPVGMKSSSAYAPPELARCRYLHSNDRLAAAECSFDSWSLGVVLFELCTGRMLFAQDISNDELTEESDKQQLCVWQTISDKSLELVFASKDAVFPEGMDAAGINRAKSDAKSLIRWCLQGAPGKRPTVSEMLSHRFVKPDADAPREIEPVLLHRHIEEGSCDEMIKLIDSGSAHPSLPMPGHADALPLHRAVRRGSIQVVRALIEQMQPDILPEILSMQLPPYHYSALHYCAVYGDADASADGPYAAIAKLLIQHGCKTSSLNHRGKTAWDLAQQLQPGDGRKHILIVVFEQCIKEDGHAELKAEQQRRRLRPNVADTFRDDLNLHHDRFTLWSITPFSQWGKEAAGGQILPLAQGGFGKVYLVMDISPPIEVTGRLFRSCVLKVPKQFKQAVDDLKEEVERLGPLAHPNVVQILGMVNGPEPDGTEAWMMALECV